MKLYAQQGHGTGDKINEGLDRGYIDGAILSPKDYHLDRLKKNLEHFKNNYPNADRMVDPQYYATLIASIDGVRLGKLTSDEYSYFEARRRGQLESEMQIQNDLETTLRFQASLPVTHILAPNIIIPQSLNSIEAVVAKNFIRNTRSVWSSLSDDRPIYTTIAIGADALRDRQELEDFLTDITLLDKSPDGFYLLVRRDSIVTTNQLIDSQTLAGWMLLNHSLKLNGYEVINGYSDILTPFLGVAGADAGATGWYSNLKSFSMDRFEPRISGGKQPIPRFLSCALLNSIRFDELQRVRDIVPKVMNKLESDDFYSITNGSSPDNKTEEILQTWDAIAHLNSSITEDDVVRNIRQCNKWVDQAQENYIQVNSCTKSHLQKRSDHSHLEPLRYGIQMFTDLAEIDLTTD